MTWRERAQRVIAEKLRELVAAGADTGPAALSLRGAVAAEVRMAWASAHAFSGAAHPSKVFGQELRLALERLRDGATPESIGACGTCGVADMVPCKPINGEIQPGEYHAARRAPSKLEKQVAAIVAARKDAP